MNIKSIDFSIATASLDIFFSGCNPPYCSGCHNLELIDFSCGTDYKEWIDRMLKYTSTYNMLIKNIFLLGGSPSHQSESDMSNFLAKIVALCPQDIWLFSREDLDEIPQYFKYFCSYIKCGAYIPELKCNNNVKYGVNLATSNQHIFKKGIDY